MPDAKPSGLKGIFCPNCCGVRLTVVASRRPSPGVKIRYRKCVACEEPLTTREVVVPRTKKRRKAG